MSARAKVRSFLFYRGRFRFASLFLGFNFRERSADRQSIAFGSKQPNEYSRDRRRDFGIHLIRADVEDRFVAGDAIADFFDPAGYRTLSNALPHLRHLHWNFHRFSTPAALRQRCEFYPPWASGRPPAAD